MCDNVIPVIFYQTLNMKEIKNEKDAEYFDVFGNICFKRLCNESI